MLVNINTSPKAPASFDGLNSVAQVPTAEFDYPKGTEIFGASEPAQYIYQGIEGAVRSYKLLSDGRRQIGAFHLAGMSSAWSSTISTAFQPRRLFQRSYVS